MGYPELLGTWRCRCAKFGPIPEATQVFILLYLLTHDTFSDLHPEFIWFSMDDSHAAYFGVNRKVCIPGL